MMLRSAKQSGVAGTEGFCPGIISKSLPNSYIICQSEGKYKPGMLLFAAFGESRVALLAG